jgi:tRNA (cytidine/uridine-2'-O-)-methyltransferase
MVAIALFQPDIAPNVGTILRLAACLDIPVHIVEPAGFPWSEKSLRRAGLDYMQHTRIFRHSTFADLRSATAGSRLVLLSARARTPYVHFTFAASDILLFGREQSGVPEAVREAADVQLAIPMRAGMRSLNVAVACAMITGEALRQTGHFQP